MSQPYDATGKELIEFSPSAWLEFFGIIRPAEIVSVIDADISSVKIGRASCRERV